ncbi:MAG: DUF3618 domain-containing protein [Aeromicrobium erythreum]
MSTDRDRLQAEVDATREHLAETVDALGHKLDVPGRAKDKASELGAAAQEQAAEPRNQVAAAVLAVAAVAVLVVVLRRRR